MRPDAVTLRHALVPRTGLFADAALIAAGVVLVALAAQVRIPLPFTPVPITGQTFAVLLVGAGLGSVRGMTTLSLYAVVGLAGVPVFTGQNGGWEYVTGATGGYIVGFVFAAGVTGWLAERRRWDRRLSSSIAAMLTGSVIIYIAGLVWLAQVLDAGLEATLAAGLYPFVVGDLLKVYLAAALLPATWALVERVRGNDA